MYYEIKSPRQITLSGTNLHRNPRCHPRFEGISLRSTHNGVSRRSYCACAVLFALESPFNLLCPPNSHLCRLSVEQGREILIFLIGLNDYITVFPLCQRFKPNSRAISPRIFIPFTICSSLGVLKFNLNDCEPASVSQLNVAPGTIRTLRAVASFI